MSDQDLNVFNEPTATATPEPVTPAVASPMISIPDSVKEYIGEGKQYTSTDAALQSIPHAQSHIAKIEAENAALRDTVAKGKTTEDILNSINANQPRASDPAPVPVDSSAIASQVLNTIEQKAAQQQIMDNINKADTEAKVLYGDKAGEVTREVAGKLGVGLDFMQNVAAESPLAFAKLLSDNTAEAKLPPAHMQSSINVDALNSNAPVDDLKRPTKSILSGASQTDVVNEWRRCKTLAEKDLAS